MVLLKDLGWIIVGLISMVMLIDTLTEIVSGVHHISWGSVGAVLMLGGILGLIPYLPARTMKSGSWGWLILGLGALLILGLWPRPGRWIGTAGCLLVAAVGHFWYKWRSRKKPTES